MKPESLKFKQCPSPAKFPTVSSKYKIALVLFDSLQCNLHYVPFLQRAGPSPLQYPSTIEGHWEYDSSSCSIRRYLTVGKRKGTKVVCPSRLKTEGDEPWWPLSLLRKETAGPFCSRKVRDSSLTREFKCVCDQGGWPSAGLNGRIMGSGSEADGLWGALFSLPPPVIHHISSWYWEIAVPHWRKREE